MLIDVLIIDDTSAGLLIFGFVFRVQKMWLQWSKWKVKGHMQKTWFKSTVYSLSSIHLLAPLIQECTPSVMSQRALPGQFEQRITRCCCKKLLDPNSAEPFGEWITWLVDLESRIQNLFTSKQLWTLSNVHVLGRWTFWLFLPFRATAAGRRCCSPRAARSPCRCTSWAGPRRSCPGTGRPSRCRCSWRRWAPSGPGPRHVPATKRARR